MKKLTPISAAAVKATEHLDRIVNGAQALIAVRDKLSDAAGGQELVMMDPTDRFDDCIAGICKAGGVWRVVYNKQAVVFTIARELDVAPVKALEILEDEIFPQFTQLLAQPIFMTELEDVIGEALR